MAYDRIAVFRERYQVKKSKKERQIKKGFVDSDKAFSRLLLIKKGNL